MPTASSNFTAAVAVGKVVSSFWRTCSMVKRGQLKRIVHTRNFRLVVGMTGYHHPAVCNRHGHHIRQVVLVLAVVIGQPA